MRWFPVVMLVVFFIFVGVGRMALQRLRFGRWGWALSAGGLDPAQLILIAAALAVLAQGTVLAWRPHAMARFVLPSLSSHPLLAGALATLALLIVLSAQLQMGASWRIGIEEGTRPGLVTHGLFAFTRNPIYVGLIGGLVAFALAVPTWLSLATLVLAVISILRIVRREEGYLRRTYGPAFEDYVRRVPRFM